MHPELSITTAVIDDARLITDFSVITFTEAFGSSNTKEDMDIYISKEINLNKIASELADPANIFFLARMNNSLVGFVKLSDAINQDAPAGHKPIEINRLYVLKEYQSRQIGAAMIAHSISYAKAHQHDVIWLGVWEHNNRAIDFYVRCGFEQYATHPFLLGTDLQTDILMKKEIR